MRFSQRGAIQIQLHFLLLIVAGGVKVIALNLQATLTAVPVTSHKISERPFSVATHRVWNWLMPELKDHRQRIPRFVIRRYLERLIHRKLFCNIQSLQITTIFQEKSQFAKIYCRGICDLYLWS